MRPSRLCFAFLLVASAHPVGAQQSIRDSAMAVFDRGRMLDAVPLFEQVIAADSTDRVAYERLGFAVIGAAARLPDAAARKEQRARGHALFVKAISLGSTNPQVFAMVRAIAADGGDDAVFSKNTDADSTMRHAEAAFARQDFRSALTQYQNALAIDTTLYDAAVFIGDSYMELQLLDSTYLWYGRATEINPDRETAWRYWSGVLLKNNQLDAARDKAIETIVAEPYASLTRQTLVSWAQRAHVPVGFPKANFPSRDTAASHTRARMAYDSVRREWHGSDGTMTAVFAAHYPKDSVYRHSMMEEVEALRAAQRTDDDSNTVNLKRLDDAGLLPAYVLFVRTDAGIARDYVAYRAEHRDLLKEFWARFVVGAPNAKGN